MLIKFKKIIYIFFLFQFQLTSIAESNNRKERNKVNIGVTNFLTALDPVTAWNHQHYLLFQCVFQTLVRIEENGSLVGDLAERWSFSNDHKTYTFYLNKNAKFHNGDPVTAEDVAWSLSRHFWPNSGSITQSYLQELLQDSTNVPFGKIVPSIQVVDKHTLQFQLKNPYPPFISVLTLSAFTVFQKNKFDPQHPNGSGPYKAHYDVDNKRWVMKKYVNYTNIQPKTDIFYFYNIQNMEEGKRAISNGKLEVLIGIPEENENNKLPVDYGSTEISSLRNMHMYFNLNKKIFQNKSLRTDLVSLIQKPFENIHSYSKVYKFNPHFFPKGVMPFKYYSEKKIKLISPQSFKEKWQLNSKFLVLAQKGYLPSRMIQIIEDTFSSVGIQLVWSFSDNFLYELAKNEYDLLFGSYSDNFPDVDGFLDPLRNNSKSSYGNIPSKKLFQQLKDARYIENPKERLQKYSTIFKKFEEENYFAPLFQFSLLVFKKKDLFIPDSNYYYESELWKIHWK